MYHPSRGGVRGGRDQFKWDDVKVDKHRENYIGHSLMAPVGRWQKGKDLHWYARDKKAAALDAEAAKEEITRIKEEEEQAIREALGLAPKRATRPQGNRLDKQEYADLIKRGSTAEDLGAGHAEAAQVQGLGLYKMPRDQGESRSLPDKLKQVMPRREEKGLSIAEEVSGDDDDSRKKNRRPEERRGEKEKKYEKFEKKKSHDSDDRRKHHREEKRPHDSDKRKHGREKRRRHDSDSD